MTDQSEYTRRHSRWYERFVLSFSFQLFAGVIIHYISIALPIWGVLIWEQSEPNIVTSLLGCFIAFFISTVALKNIFRLPGSETVAYVLPIVTIAYSLPLIIILIFRKTYSLQAFGVGYSTTLLWCYMWYFLGRRYRLVRYALLPFGNASELHNVHGALFEILKVPNLQGQRFNAIVADLQSSEITPDWEKFLAKCTLSRIPVYSTNRIRESLSGRVKMDHLSENEFGSLLPSAIYETLKRLIDFSTCIVLLPFIIPFFALIAVIIRLDSQGSPFFIQERMGFQGRVFRMLKFRSMHIDRQGGDFTDQVNDNRITRVGRIIRKYRIDELPQIFNILLGQMSFIGPRPESLELSKWYENDVPFFAYRHVVRPGISGWAQVEQGYAAEVDGMKLKMEYDFYYIKNFSFWLDLLITFKTVKTIVTGFGAR